ncbi:MAG TPA: alpha/beta hydrolase [Clostridia bacterium]|nr:alpha/beta hydrolase [Clostridia bacterium]
MSLSLEVKKFINSEHIGEYVEIVLPAPEYPERGSRKKPVKEKKAEAPDAAETTEGIDAEAAEDVLKAAAEETVPVTEEPAAGEKVRMHYVEAGVGEPLILVHTIAQSVYTWRSAFNRLSEYYRVIAVDLLGHGYSDRPDTFGYTIEEHAESLRLFMDAIGVKSAHFMGFSMSCAYVAQLAVTAPERMGRIIFLAPGGISPEMPLPVRMIDSTVLGPIAAMLYGVHTVESVLSQCFFDLTCLTSEVATEYYRTISDPAGRRAVRHSLHYFDDTVINTRLREVEQDILILQGGEDKWRSQTQAEFYHAAFKNACFAVVRNAGHLLHEEKPDKLLAATLEFIPVAMPGE